MTIRVLGETAITVCSRLVKSLPPSLSVIDHFPLSSMEMHLVQISYGQHLAFRTPEDAARCVEALLRGKQASEQSMNGKTAFAIQDDQARFEVRSADVYPTVAERHAALAVSITYWINHKRHTTDDRSVTVKGLKELAGISKEQKLFQKVGEDLKAIDDTHEYRSITLNDGDEFVTQA